MSAIARLTLAEYDRMIEHAILAEDRRIELIHGELREMRRHNPPHEDAVDRLNRWSFRDAPEKSIRVRVQNSLELREQQSAPRPDIAWVRRQDYSRSRPLPSDVLLVIEVADSSLDYDRGEKAALYAAAGLADYWVVNIPMKCIEVFRQPQGGKYHDTRAYGLSESVAPLSLPSALLPVATLFGTGAAGQPR